MTDLNKERDLYESVIEKTQDIKMVHLVGISFNEEKNQYEVPDEKWASELTDACLELNTGWFIWQECVKAKAQAVPEGYVVVPFKLTNIDANRLAEIEFKESETLFKLENRGLTESEIAVRKSRWLEWKADQIKESHSKVTKFISESGAEG